MCRNFDVAVRLLDYSNRLNNGNELIVVRSEMLADIKGIIEFDEAKVKWLGFDVVALGEWSLLRDGLFASASSFPGWEAKLNDSGLFASPIFAPEFIQAYGQAAARGSVETFSEELYGIDTVEVGSVSVSRQ